MLEKLKYYYHSWCKYALCSLLLLSVFWSATYYGIDKDVLRGVHTDVEHDYIGNAIAISEGENPTSFRKPGTPLQHLLSIFVKDIVLSYSNIKDILNSFYIFNLLLSIISIIYFYQSISKYISTNILWYSLIPITLLLPSVIFYMHIYSDEMFTFAWSIFVISYAVSILNTKKEVAIWELIILGFLLGLGVAMRFSSLAVIISLLMSIFIISFFKNTDHKYSNYQYYIVLIIGVFAVLLMFYNYNSFTLRPRKVVVPFILLNLVLFPVFIFTNSTYVMRSGLSFILPFTAIPPLILKFTGIINTAAFAYVLFVEIFVERTVNAFIYEYNNVLPQSFSGKINQSIQGLSTVFSITPLYVAILLLLLFISTIILIYYICFRNVNQWGFNYNNLGIMLFLTGSIFGVLFGGLSHPWMGGVDLCLNHIGSGTPMGGVATRTIILTAPFVSVLLIVVSDVIRIEMYKKIYYTIFLLLMISGITFGVIFTKKIYNCTLTIKKESYKYGSILNKYEIKLGRKPKTLFWRLPYPPAEIHYSIRQYANHAGIERYKAAYPHIVDTNQHYWKNIKKNIIDNKFDLFIALPQSNLINSALNYTLSNPIYLDELESLGILDYSFESVIVLLIDKSKILKDN